MDLHLSTATFKTGSSGAVSNLIWSKHFERPSSRPSLRESSENLSSNGSNRFRKLSEPSGTEPNYPGSSGFDGHFAKIGRTLSICESSEIGVGIPLLPPTRSVRALRSERQGSLDEFLRLSLVEVPTSALILYAEALESALERTITEPELKLFQPSFLERNLFPVLSGIFTGAVALALIDTLGASPITVWFAGLIAGGISTMTAGAFVSDDHRLSSLLHVLNIEIYRREGIDPEGSGNLRICVT